MTPTQAFAQAREFLMTHREDYEAAYSGFEWPKLDQFNWALDWFDAHAKGNDRPALWVVDEDGGEQRLSFAELSQRSNRVANFLRAQGVKRGDRILLMLGNVVPLWEVMLASIKLGSVVIPATTLLGARRSARPLRAGRRPPRGRRIGGRRQVRRHRGRLHPHRRGGPAPGWTSLEEAYAASAEFAPDGPTLANDPILLYFTSGTTTKPKLVEHSHQSYPVGHLSTMYWLGLKEGDVHLNISSPGWAKHAWSCFFAPWNAGATIFIYNYARFNAKAVLDAVARCGVTTLCAPPTVWRMFIQEEPRRVRGQAARGDRRRRAAQPGDHRASEERLGPDAPRRLRPDGDDGADRQLARPDAEAGFDGPAAAGLPGRAARSRRQ